MRYFMSIIPPADLKPEPVPQGLMDAMGPWMEKCLADGTLISTGGLKPASEGRRLAGHTGTLAVTDGPFAEAKEVLGGYWMIEVKSREEAIDWAKRCPGSENEVIEVRQVQEMSDFPEDVQQAAAGFEDMQRR